MTDFEIIEKEEVTLDMKDPKITEYFQLVGTIAQERGLDYQVFRKPFQTADFRISSKVKMRLVSISICVCHNWQNLCHDEHRQRLTH